jgi:hypothetical protein
MPFAPARFCLRYMPRANLLRGRREDLATIVVNPFAPIWPNETYCAGKRGQPATRENALAQARRPRAVAGRLHSSCERQVVSGKPGGGGGGGLRAAGLRTIFLALTFLAGAFLTIFFAAAFLTDLFLAAAFFIGLLLAIALRAVFLTAPFFAVAFFATLFFAAAFLAGFLVVAFTMFKVPLLFLAD